MRSVRHLLLLAFMLMLAVPASALSMPGSTSIPGPAGGTVGGGGGAGKVFMNDVLGVNEGYYLTFERAWNRQVFLSDSCEGRVCATTAAFWAPQYMSGSNRPTAANAHKGASYNREAGAQVAWRNRCKVNQNVITSSDPDCEFNASGVSGAGSWGEVHVDAPLREPLHNPIRPYMSGGAEPPMGAASHVSIRVWRECRMVNDKYVTAGTHASSNPDVQAAGSKCKVAPIYERTIPFSDSGSTQQTYFWSRRLDGVNKPTGDWTNSAFQAIGKDGSAGVLFGNCRVDAKNSAAKELCEDASGYNGDTSTSFYNEACSSGGLAKIGWNADEVKAELAYLTSREYNPDTHSRDFWRARRNTIAKWADGNRKTIPVSAKRRFCEDFSEWLAVHWTVPGHDASKKTKIRLRFNAVPGRVYGVQVVVTDSRENILQQSFQMLTGRASTCCGGGDGGDGGGDPLPPMPAVTPPAPGELAVKFPMSAIAGTRVNGTVDVAPNAPEDSSGLGQDRANRHSLWLPRALSYGVFNFADNQGSDDEALNRYARNHQNPQIQGGGDGFNLSGRGMARKPAHPRVSNGSDGDRTESQLDHIGGSARYFSAFAPLLRTDTTVLHSSLSMATQDPTRTANDPWVQIGGHLFPNFAAKARADEVRNATLIGEAKYASFGNVNAPTSYRWERLTMDTCNDGVSTRYPKIPGEGCNPNKSLGHGWTAKDAYYVPARNSGEVALDALFTQDEEGEARIQLTGTDPALHSRVRRIEVWDHERYLNRSPGDLPNYYIGEDRAFNADGEIRFCKATIPVWVDPPPQPHHHAVDYNVPAYHRLWWRTPWTAGAPDQAHPHHDKAFYTEEYFGGNGIVDADVAFWRHRTKGLLWQIDQHPGQNPPKSWGNFPADYDKIWGRSWWDDTVHAPGPDGIADNVGRTQLHYEWTTWTDEPGRWEQVPNPECMAHPNGANKNAHDPEAVYNGGWPDGLKPGQYVVRYIIQPGPAFHWGIRARLRTNDTATWNVRFDLQNRQNFLQVFRTRTAG